MKVYLCVASEYEGSETFKVCKSKKKAEYIAKQVNRLYEVYEKLRELNRERQLKYWNDNPQLIDSTRVDNYYHLDDWKKISKLQDKVQKTLQEFGADSWYRHCHVEERKLE